MIITTREFQQLYECIKEEYYASEERKLVIFVSKTEVDSLCALRILQGFLNAEGIHYSVYPVTNYTDISSIAARELDGSEDYKNIIMINCGATEPVLEHLNMGDDWSSTCRITIIDSRRPIYHKYNTGDHEDNVVVVVDEQDPFPKATVPEYDQLLDEDLNGDNDDKEDNDEDEEDDRPSRRRRLNEETDLSREDKHFIEERREKRRDQLQDYYVNHQGHGKPTSMVMFELAHSLHYRNTLYLWCAIMGVTEHLMHQRLNLSGYNNWRASLVAHVEMADNYQRSEQHIVEDDVMVKKPQGSAKIKLQEDFWLPMLRQWTIYDAMLSSSYMATKMETYRDLGVDRLQLLLAKMGIPLAASKKSWASIQPRYRRAFKDKLTQHASDSNLSIQDMTFDSFQLLHGHDLQLSAADAVHAAAAILSHPDEDHRHFWRACSSLDVEQGTDRLRRGLELAKSLQTRIIIDTGMAIVRKQLEATKNGLCCFLNLTEADMLNPNLFAHPIPLLRVAIFVQQHVQHKFMVSKPVVVVSPPMPGAMEGQETCLVLGLGKRSKDPAKPVVNTLGHLFGMAAGKMDSMQGATYPIKYGFDAAVAELMRQDIDTFQEELKYCIIQLHEGNLQS